METVRISINGMDLTRPPWWEGNVVMQVVSGLESLDGYQRVRVADTSTRERGPDAILRAPNGRTLWISAKGWPVKSEYAQARHWFDSASMEMVRWRDPSNRAKVCRSLGLQPEPEVDLVMALPFGFTIYHELARTSEWLQTAVPFRIIWANTGAVLSTPSGRSRPINLMRAARDAHESRRTPLLNETLG